MRLYLTPSGTLFGMLALVQLLRVLFRWPLIVAAVTVPLWPSVLAVLVAGTLSVWAFRLAAGTHAQTIGTV